MAGAATLELIIVSLCYPAQDKYITMVKYKDIESESYEVGQGQASTPSWKEKCSVQSKDTKLMQVTIKFDNEL